MLLAKLVWSKPVPVMPMLTRPAGFSLVAAPLTATAETVRSTVTFVAAVLGTIPLAVMTWTSCSPAGTGMVSVQESCVEVPVAVHLLPPTLMMASLVGRLVPEAMTDKAPINVWASTPPVGGASRLKSQLLAGQRASMPPTFKVNYGSSLSVESISRGTGS